MAEEAIGSPSATTAIFIRLLGVALIAHVVGDQFGPYQPELSSWLRLAVGWSGIALLVRPSRTISLLAASSMIASIWVDMPFIGNHWLVACLVAAAVLVSGGIAEAYLPAARWILIVFYSFAAFAKQNAGFFDPSVSCGAFYADQSLASFGLPSLSDRLAPIPIWSSAVIEGAIPVLLLLRRTRYAGVLLATAFHTLISFDLSQHFYDFTALLLPLFFAFVPVESAESIERLRSRVAARIGAPAIGIAVGILIVLVAASQLPRTGPTLVALQVIPVWLWIPFSSSWLVLLVMVRRRPEKISWKLRPATSVVVALAWLNGLTPYTEIKTAYGFNMYANLVTAGGESNHFLIRRTWPLRHGYDKPVKILETNDAGLDLYRKGNYLIAYPQLRRYLARRPDTRLVFERDGVTVSAARARDIPELVDPGPWWWRLFPLRAIDAERPPRCQDVFLPAL